MALQEPLYTPSTETPSGVHSRVEEPIQKSPEQLASELTCLLRNAVGALGLREVESLVRGVMVEEALTNAEGNRRAAARTLQVSRQHLQHMIRKLNEECQSATASDELAH